jgi:hypothetical protein
MKDDRGPYYYPFPGNRRVRMYVKWGPDDDQIHFRLWKSDDPGLWQQHGWLSEEAITQAAGLYSAHERFNPGLAYDPKIARTLLQQEGPRPAEP